MSLMRPFRNVLFMVAVVGLMVFSNERQVSACIDTHTCDYHNDECGYTCVYVCAQQGRQCYDYFAVCHYDPQEEGCIEYFDCNVWCGEAR
jgi:hypothetical protein